MSRRRQTYVETIGIVLKASAMMTSDVLRRSYRNFAAGWSLNPVGREDLKRKDAVGTGPSVRLNSYSADGPTRRRSRPSMHEESDGHYQYRQCAKADHCNSKPDVSQETLPVHSEIRRERKHLSVTDGSRGRVR